MEAAIETKNGSHACCPHVVGMGNTRHGPFAPGKQIVESAFRCCHCGRYWIGIGGPTCSEKDITFLEEMAAERKRR